MNTTEEQAGVELTWMEQPCFTNSSMMERMHYNELTVKYWLALCAAPDGAGNGLIEASYTGIGAKSGLTAKQVIRVIARLKNRGEISVKRLCHGLAITLFNYEQIQRDFGVTTRATVTDEQGIAKVVYGVNTAVALTFSAAVAKAAFRPTKR